MSIPEKDKDFYRYTKDHRFAVMYPLLAKEIVKKYGVTKGVCLDIGAGSAALSIELSKITDLSIISLDAEPEAIEMAKENCVLHNVPEGRIRFVNAPVEKMTIADASVDFIVSRGSIPFWKDHVAAFKEIQRVLAPEGIAMVGCGFSHYQTPEEVKKMRPSWSADTLKERTKWKRGDFLSQTLRQADVTLYDIVDDSYGTWIEIRKSGSKL